MRPQIFSALLLCSLPLAIVFLGSGCGGGSSSIPVPTNTPTGTALPTATATTTSTPSSPIPTRFENDLIYSKNRGGQFGYGLFRSNADGSDERTLVDQDALQKVSRGAAISPNGLQVAFYSDVSGGNGFLYLMNANGTNVRSVPIGRGIAATPAWSRDGKRIVAINRLSGRPFLVNSDGSNFQSPGSDSIPALKQPTFSLDGRSIYSTTLSPNATLVKFQLDTATVTPVETGNVTEIQSPRFSPDGQTLAFIGQQSATQRGVYLANIDGSNAQLVGNTTDAVRVVWSPTNGLAFETTQGLFTIGRDGSNRHFVTAGFDFDWR